MKNKIFSLICMIISFIIISCSTEEPVYHTVSFDSNGGSFVTAQTVEQGKKVKEPEEPVRDEYIFAGWFKDGEIFYFDTPITEDLILRAEWYYIGSVPTPPAKLYAYYVNNSEDVNKDYYNVMLVWETSQYVICYEIELTEYQLSTDGSNVEEVADSAKIYGLKAVNDTVDEDFAGAEICYAGNVMSTSTCCTLKLPLGHLYDVRIRAANYAGQSEWTNRTKPASSIAIPAGTTVAYAGVTNRLNRLRITYNLNGGSLWLDGSKYATYEADYTNTYINYRTWAGGSINPDLMKPSTTPFSGKPYLIKGATRFSGWYETSTGIIVTNYSYKNLLVTALFGY